MFVLAHLSDPHLGPIPTPRARELANKRGLGFINWYRGRHAVHRPEVLALVERDIAARDVDHIAVTGDLVNLALTAEFAAAHQWLARLGPPSAASSSTTAPWRSTSRCPGGTRVHSMALPVSQLWRMGSSIFESVRTSWWQFMQVSVGGTIARGARSTLTWQ